MADITKSRSSAGSGSFRKPRYGRFSVKRCGSMARKCQNTARKCRNAGQVRQVFSRLDTRCLCFREASILPGVSVRAVFGNLGPIGTERTREK